ncbi:hypothetical protein ANN_17260 [Periplaneta americana]|uniref:Uncharacterized protein n=1 Tax=Periplaneta americana TaxID=6978 RepID=A0ABQ8SSG2_PERAM|nr:hypothetical protein ANN_17260 [Periplaneta americana]
MAEIVVEILEANLQLIWLRTQEELFYIKRRESLKSYKSGVLAYGVNPGNYRADNYAELVYTVPRAVASRSKAPCLGLALRNARWFESSWGKKFSHEMLASVWDRCPPSMVMHLGSYDR